MRLVLIIINFILLIESVFCFSFKPETLMSAVVDIIVADKNEDTSDSSIVNGSGFFIDSTGFIVTNNHVIEAAEKIKIITEDGNEYIAKVIATDSHLDIALLKIDLEPNSKVQVLSFTDSDKVKLLDNVFIIGNPLGIGKSIINGGISGKNRDLSKLTSELGLDGNSILFFQINADACQGYSGGPVCDKNGNVIGVITMLMSENTRGTGMCFAIPSNLAQKTIKQLREYGKMQRSWLGFSVRRLDHETAKSLLHSNIGYYVDRVADNSPAKSIGINSGDIIVSINDIEISGNANVGYILNNLPVGKVIPIQVIQNGGIARKLSITVAPAPEDEEMFVFNDNDSEIPCKKIGNLPFSVTNLIQSMREVFNIPSHENGVLVSSVDRSDTYNIYPGCVIKTVNQQEINDVESFKNLIKNKDKIVLYVYDPYTKTSFYTSVHIEHLDDNNIRKGTTIKNQIRR